MTHTELVNLVVMELCKVDGVRAFKMNVGMGRTMSGNLVRFGFKGLTDIIGIKAPKGRWFAFDVKIGSDHLTQEQKAFIYMIRAHGGFGGEVRSLEQAINWVKSEE